jgi:hypothetical protein
MCRLSLLQLTYQDGLDFIQNQLFLDLKILAQRLTHLVSSSPLDPPRADKLPLPLVCAGAARVDAPRGPRSAL